MNCPACKSPLREKAVPGMTVDVCVGGCGGIWFDATELQRVDARAASTLHTVRKHEYQKAPRDEPRACPRCTSQLLDRRWFSDAKSVEIDQCGKCAGIWLDEGEFARLAEEIKTPKRAPPAWAVAMWEAANAVDGMDPS